MLLRSLAKLFLPQETLHSLTKCCDGNRMRWEKQLRNVSRGNATLLNEKENVLQNKLKSIEI